MTVLRYAIMAVCVLTFVSLAASPIVYLTGDRGSGYDALVAKVAPPDDVAFTGDFLRLVRDDKYDSFVARLNPDIRPHLGPTVFDPMRREFPAGEAVETKPIGVHVSTYVRGGTSTQTVSITLLYRFPSCWVSGEVVTASQGNSKIVQGVHVKRWAESLRDAHRVTLSNAGAMQLLMLLLAIAIPVFMLTTALVCARTVKSTKSLWFWIPFILIGAGTISFNWTTGELQMDLLRTCLFGAGYNIASPYSPLILIIALPVGAAGFWGTRHHRLRDNLARARPAV
jgi:hypothetical protein